MNEHGDGMLYNGPWSSQCPESAFPEMERRYYNEMLRQQFPDSQEEVTSDVERRHELKKVSMSGVVSLCKQNLIKQVTLST